MPLLHRSCWVFDMDGTLTVPVHDFDAIRAALGLREGHPILEELAAMPVEQAAPLRAKLAEIELDLARGARAWPAAAGLLESLGARGAKVGILTRNRSDLARVTLEAAGLDSYFRPVDVLGRDDAEPKPSPEGIQKLMNSWGGQPHDTVMVGDYVFDLMAGRAAGAATVLVNRRGVRAWDGWADRVIQSLDELL